MAEFSQEVEVNVELNAEDTEGALAEIGAALTAIKSSANTLGDDLDKIEDDLQGFSESFDQDQDLQIGGTVDTKDINEAVINARKQANTMVMAERNMPKIPVGAEMNEDQIKDEIGEEESLLDDLEESFLEATESKEKFKEENAEVAKRTKASVTELKREESAFDDIVDSGDTLTDVKQKVSGANQHLAKMSRETARDIAKEDDEMMGLFESMNIVERKMSDTSDNTSATKRALNKMRRSTDNATDSMRAAAEVGDVFEDGLGSLSVNLGAFTVALRNFLTQVPLLLTGLASVGAAALGAASAFLALAGALGAVVAAGALGHAQQLKDEYSGIEELGQSMQVIMLNLKDTFLQAFQPLLDNEATVDIFIATIEGLAKTVNSAVTEIAGLTEGTDEFASRVEEGSEPLFTVQDAMEDISSKVGPALRDLYGSLTIAFEELGEEAVAGTAMMVSGLANAVDFSVWLFDQIDDLGDLLSQFNDTLTDLAVIGARIGGGLLPVFKAFSTIVETVAEGFRTMDSETMQSMITFLALMAALNRLSGVMGSLLTIFPNVVAGMAKISAQASATSGSIATMRVATAAAGAQLGGFLEQTAALSGFTSLATSLTSTSSRMRDVAFNSVAASEAFEELADDTDFASDELRELAVQGMFTNEVLEDLGNQKYNITPERQLDPKQFLPDDPITNAMFGNVGDAAEDAADDIDQSMGRLDPRGGTFRLRVNEPDLGPIDKMKKSVRGLGGSLKRVGARARDTVKSFGSLLGRIVMLQVNFLATAAVMTGKFILAMGRTAAAAVKAAGAIAMKTIMVYQYTGSLSAASSTLWGLVSAQVASAAATARDAAVKAAGAVANFLLSTSALVATSSMYALATSIAVATGGISILVGIIGALAVGIITNFDAIKSAAQDSFGFLKEIIDVIVDVLLTYFITVWNLLVDIFLAVVEGVSPLTDMFSDLAESIGLMGGKGEDGASAMDMISAAGDVAKGVIKGLGTVFGVVIDIFGAVLTIATTLIRVALTPMIVTIQLLVGALGLLADAFDFILKGAGVENGFSGLVDVFEYLFDIIMAGIAAIPGAVEKVINFLINGLNKIFGFINSKIPGVDLGQVDNIDFTQSSELKADREELSSDTANMRDRTAEKGDKTITYNEDNSTNIDQTIDADPEDQAQLSRVVTDAIAEANSFERRRQGGQ